MFLTHGIMAYSIIAYKTNWVKIGMTEYKPGDGIIVGVDNDTDLPEIGKILKLYVLNSNDDICLEVWMFHSHYEPHYRLYSLDQSAADNILYVYYSELVIPVPVHICSSVPFGHKKLFILPYAL